MQSSKKRTIIVRAGEIVTPNRSRATYVTTKKNIPTVMATGRLPTALPRSTPQSATVERYKSSPESEAEVDYGSDGQLSEVADSDTHVTLDIIYDKLISLDSKLDQIMAKLGHHDTAFKVFKQNIKDLRTQLQNSVGQTAAIIQEDMHSERKRPRKRLVLFPVADDNYLLRLEELAQTDDDIREELNERFLEAPGTSAYDFVRKNLLYLFENTSKYTWTGREGSAKNMAGNASKLQLVDILIGSACEKFPSSSREEMERVCHRVLKNFNNTKYFKIPNRLAKKELAVRELIGGTSEGDQAE